ncbi:MAG: 30S ribosomal protein S4 [Candidatus Thermoplasmatota archaeon]|nr:30S ribosomal protein S4 [Candidatus Thermoplasmatota archaeon]
MGDPKKPRRKYFTPSHPWEGERIAQEKEIVKKYGLKNKKDVWKAQSVLRNYRAQAKDLMARTRVADVQAQTEVDLLKKKLTRRGLLGNESTLNDILALQVDDVLNRRLQTVVYHKGLANSQKQARQFVTHGHISIGGRIVTIPGLILTKKEEEEVAYNEFSDIANELHPARPQDHPPVPAETTEEAAKEDKPAIKLTQKAKKVLKTVKSDEEDASEAADIPDEPLPEEVAEETKDEKKAEETKPENKGGE